MKFNRVFTLITGASFLFGSFAAYADHGHSSCHVDNFKYPDLLDYAKVKQAKNGKNGGGHVSGNGSLGGFGSPVNTDIQCGDVITSNSALTADLDCENSTGFVLKIEGDGITFNGQGHKIIAPISSAGIFVQGNSDIVKNVIINGVTQGYGIFAYDSPGIQISGNILIGNMTGIMVYAETVQLTNAAIFANIASNSLLFGVRTSQDGAGSVVNPSITMNDFGNSGSYAMSIQAASYELSGLNAINMLTNSLNGIYLKTGSFNIHDLSLSLYGIQNAQIAVDTASNVQVSNLDVSTFLAPNAQQEHVGLDLYRVSRFSISKLTAKKNDVGLKLETDSGVECTGSVSKSTFANNTVAGIMITSYDATQYGVLQIGGNTFNEAASALEILLEPDTTLSAGSLLGTLHF